MNRLDVPDDPGSATAKAKASRAWRKRMFTALEPKSAVKEPSVPCHPQYRARTRAPLAVVFGPVPPIEPPPYLEMEPADERFISMKRVQLAVVDYFGITMRDLLSTRRSVAIARPRQIAMYLAHTLTEHSYPEIGRRFGGKDHSTVIHAKQRIARMIVTDARIAAAVDEISRRLTA